MKVIRKQISLEPFKSRLPSIIPAYDDNGKQHDFLHIIDLNNEPIMNYGMIPFDVKVINDSSLGEYSDKLYSYYEIVNFFHKFDKSFNENINDKCLPKENLTNTDYNFYQWLLNNCFPFFIFDIELKDKNVNLNDIKSYWGTNRLSIQEVSIWYTKLQVIKTLCESEDNDKYCCQCLDYEKRGGDIFFNALKTWYDNNLSRVLCNIKDYGHDYVYEVEDTDKTVTVKVLKQQNNSKVITTHTFEIHEPRIRVLGNNRYIKYGELDSNDRIGKTINIEIIDGVLTIPCLIVNTNRNLIVSEPSISIPLTLNNSMEYLGEMSSICEYWDDGYEYNKNIDIDSEYLDYDGGVMVYYNNDNWILKSYNDSPGYIYSSKYKEIYFANTNGMTDDEYINFSDVNNKLKNGYSNTEQWERYFDYLPSVNDLQISSYAYKGNILILDPNRNNMSTDYLIETNNNLGFVFKDNKLYPIFECDCVNINNKLHQVFYVYEDVTNNVKLNPYIEVQNKKIYIKNKVCNGNNYTIEEGLDVYIINNEIQRKTNNDTIIDGYCVIDDETIYFSYEDNKMQTDQLGEYSNINSELKGYSTYIKDNKYYVRVGNDFVEYSSELISGETSSKLNNLIDTNNIAVDNLGNVLDGLMPYEEVAITRENGDIKQVFIHKTNAVTNDWLCIPYIPKYTSDIEEIQINDDIKYWGNIINNVIITYDLYTSLDDTNLNSEINKHNRNNVTSYTNSVTKTWYNGETIYSEKKYSFKQDCKTNEDLKSIEKLIINEKNKIQNIKCFVEYYVGTIMSKNDENEYELFLDGNNNYYGIKYNDEFTLEHGQCLYYHTDFDTSLLNYWKMNPKTKTYTNQTYNVSNLTEQISYFEFRIKPFDLQYGFVDYFNQNNKFYKVDELDESVEIIFNGNKIICPIYIKVAKKYFSIKISNDNITIYDDYNYYCVIDNIKYYSEYDEKIENYKIIISDDEIYYYNANSKKFIDDENVVLSNDIYCEIPIKLYLLHVNGTFDTYFDYTNNMTVSPLIINENKLGMATLEKISGDIYIDRGTTRAFDFHLRLLESKSLESLEQIGNGFFNFTSNNETK